MICGTKLNKSLLEKKTAVFVYEDKYWLTLKRYAKWWSVMVEGCPISSFSINPRNISDVILSVSKSVSE